MLMEEFGKMWIWKGEVEELFGDLKGEISHINKEMSHMKGEIMNVRDHVDVVVENIRYDLQSANREAIEVLKDRSKDHGKRIGVLEQAVGLAA